MQINGLSGGFPDPAALGKRGEAIETVGSPKMQTAQFGAHLAAGSIPLLSKILGAYNITDISAEGFSEMIQRLHAAGHLSDKQLQELSLIRLDLDLSGIDPDEPIDLLEFYADKSRELERKLRDCTEEAQGVSADLAHLRQSLATVRRRLDWLEKFALIQSAPGRAAMDTLV